MEAAAYAVLEPEWRREEGEDEGEDEAKEEDLFEALTTFVFDSDASTAEVRRWVKAWTWYVNLVLYQQRPHLESERVIAKWRAEGKRPTDGGIDCLLSGPCWVASFGEWECFSIKPILEMVGIDLQWLQLRREI